MRLLVLAAVVAALTPGQAVQAQEAREAMEWSAGLPTVGPTLSGVSLGRYTTQSAVPTPEITEPLRAVVRIHYPRSLVASVGDALRHTLMRTGYRLDEAAAAAPAAREFLALPLPESQRAMGPYTVETILQTLMGPAWVVVQSPVHRSVSFDLRVIRN